MTRAHFALPALGLMAVLCAFGCTPKYPKCNQDKDCRAHEYCVNGNCEQCRNDGDCATGRCNGGRCEAKPGPVSCSDDNGCPPGQSCLGGVCKPCALDSECGEGGKCAAGRCQRPISSGDGSGGGGGGGPCALETVFFDFNESALSVDATNAIDRDAECIKKGAGKPVTLTGRTDTRGTEEYNLALSDKRAQSVRDRLSRMGVSAALKTVARGEMDATGTDEAGWAKDRRVDLSW